jgi:DNA polymerase elongation subunit (family B)
MKGRDLAEIEPGTLWECQQFIEKYKDVDGFSVYGSDRYDHQFIQDYFGGQVDWDRSLVNVTSIDLECVADKGFPDIRSAPQPITAITVKNNIDNIYYTWGMGEYETDRKDVQYVQCADEPQLLTEFLLHWTKNYPDIVTGWNTRFFDLPYIRNRICRVLGDDSSAAAFTRQANLLSPWKEIRDREVTANRLPVIEIAGIQQLDYLDLFRKFAYTYGTQESYSLNNIAHVVLGEKKIDYSEFKDLNELYEKNHQKFIEYNIMDVELVDRLEDKLGLITLAMTIAYKAGVNYNDTFANVPVWDAIINRNLREKGVIEDGRKYQSKDGQIEGAHVKDPQKGLHEWVVSFDLNSLYPHLIMQYNMSPETIINDTIDCSVDDLLAGKEYDIPEGYCMSARGNLFNTSKKGLLPKLVEQYYDDRVVAKKEMLKTEQELQTFEGDKFERYKLEKKIATLGNQQMAIKILMNSLYGAMSNEYFRYFDPRIAESITMSGQLTIRYAEKVLNEYINKVLKTDNKDYIIAIDTDSLYVNLSDLVRTTLGDNVERNKGAEFVNKVSTQKIEPILEKAYEELRAYLKAPVQKMVMAREVIADKGIWTGKKHYILNVINSEGVQYKEPKLKMMGIEAVRSSTPMVCRNYIKDTLRLIMDTDEITCQEYIKDLKKEFNSLPVEDVAFPRGVSNLDKYKSSGPFIYGKSTPIHVRGALVYNHHLKESGYQNKYDEIFGGDKIKFCYLKLPNLIKENVIAFKNVLPDELNIREYVDYDKQFDKGYLEAIGSIMTAIGWSPERRQRTLEDFWA